MYDVIIIGGGPAGLTAAIYSARGGLKTLVLEGNILGGELAEIKEIENYPGFRGEGRILADGMKSQAVSFGAEIITQNAESVSRKGDSFGVMTQTSFYEGKSVIIATGVRRKSDPMYDAMYGKGVSYCATCDGFFYRGETVAVVGGGNTAAEDAIYLSALCKEVYLINLKSGLRCEKELSERLAACANVKVMNSSVVKSVEGKDAVSGLRVFDLKTMSENSLAVTGVFVAMGHTATKPLMKELLTDENGNLILHDLVKTSVEGVFAAGDVTNPRLKQVVTAASTGAEAATAASDFISGKARE